MDQAAIPMRLQGRRGAKVRERVGRRDGLVEHKKSAGHDVSAELEFPPAAVVLRTRGTYSQPIYRVFRETIRAVRL